MQKWEYKIIYLSIASLMKKVGWATMALDTSKIESEMNEFGGAGWELISFAPMSGNTTTAWGAATSNFVLVYKRQKS